MKKYILKQWKVGKEDEATSREIDDAELEALVHKDGWMYVVLIKES